MAHLMPSLGLLLLLVIEAGPQEPPRAPASLEWSHPARQLSS